MQRTRSGESGSRHHPRGRDFEREDRFQRDDKPGRGESDPTTRSPDVSSPGTRLAPRRPAPRRGESPRPKHPGPSPANKPPRPSPSRGHRAPA
jgi:hypothetical protein